MEARKLSEKTIFTLDANKQGDIFFWQSNSGQVVCYKQVAVARINPWTGKVFENRLEIRSLAVRCP